MDVINCSFLSKNPSLLTEETIVNSAHSNIGYMESCGAASAPEFSQYMSRHMPKVHKPSPMVSRAYTGDSRGLWSAPGSSGSSDSTSRSSQVPLWTATVGYSYSPESKRDTEIILEEKINMELDNSDYSDTSQSPENSISSNDTTSSSSEDSYSEEPNLIQEEQQESQQQPPPQTSSHSQENQYTNRILSEPCRDFQEIFNTLNDFDEFPSERYHQSPKPLDREAAKRLARRLYEYEGFKITDVAKHLSKRNDFSQIVGEEFSNFFDFSDLRLDKALRLFLSRFTLTGETQERERIMHHFSKRYVACNENIYNGEDACHTLVCALIILNTNLHSQNQSKMMCNDFVLNLKDLNEGENFPINNLRDLYSAIEKEPIRWPMDDELVGIVNMPKQETQDFSKHIINPPYSISLDLPRDSNCRDFMSGYVVRKWLKEHGGRKAAFGKRGWKLFYGRLRDLTLHLYKDHDKGLTHSVKRNIKKPTKVTNIQNKKDLTSTNTLNEVTQIQPNGDHNHNIKEDSTKESEEKNNNNNNSSYDSTAENNDQTLPKTKPTLVFPTADTEIHINHAYASRAIDYVKKKNVFRIKTKYGSEYLFQVNTEKEMEGWIDNINYVAALLSDPEPIIGICTMEKLSARLIPLPKITMFNVRDQLESHQKCLMELEKVILSLRSNLPRRLDKKGRLELEESIRFREDEFQRYKTYCQLLEFELSRMQSIVNVRISNPDSSFFYQPFQISVPPSHIISTSNQQTLNYTPVTSENLLSRPFIHPQQNIRLHPSLVHQNLSSFPVNTNLRQPSPGLLSPQLLLTATATPTTNPPDSSTDIVLYTPPASKTFYEIV